MNLPVNASAQEKKNRLHAVSFAKRKKQRGRIQKGWHYILPRAFTALHRRTTCHVAYPSARRPCTPNPNPHAHRVGPHQLARTRPGPAPSRVARTTFSFPPPFFPRETPRLHTYDAPPCPAPATPLHRAPISGVDTDAYGERTPELLRPPPEPLRPRRPASWATPGSPAPNPNPSSRRGAVKVRPLLHRALPRPPPGLHGRVGSQLRYVECRAVVWVRGLSGQCRETAPAADELCCIWAGRAWCGTHTGPLHIVVAVPGLTGNVHGLKVRYVTFQRGKWCGHAQKCDFSPVPRVIGC